MMIGKYINMRESSYSFSTF